MFRLVYHFRDCLALYISFHLKMVQTFANYFQQIMRIIFFTECGTARKNPFSYLYLYLYLWFKGIGKLKASSNSRLALKEYHNFLQVLNSNMKMHITFPFSRGRHSHAKAAIINSNPTRQEISYIQEYYEHASLIFFQDSVYCSHGYHSGRQWCPLLLAADNIVGYHDEIGGIEHTTYFSIPSGHQGEGSHCCPPHFSTILHLGKYVSLLAYSFQIGNPILQQLIKWPKLSVFFWRVNTHS